VPNSFPIVSLDPSEADPVNVNAQCRRHRTYRSLLDSSHTQLVPSIGLNIEKDGVYLLHAEGSGEPHCVAVRKAGSDIKIYDGNKEFLHDSGLLEECYRNSVDARTVVTFEVCPSSQVIQWPESPSKSILMLLLDLQAGSKQKAMDTSLADDFVNLVECTGDVDESQRGECATVDLEDETIITVGDTLLMRLQDATT